MRTWPGTSSGMVGSSSQTGSRSWNARAARIASSTLQRMLASTISGKLGAQVRRAWRATRSTSSRERRAADLHLDRAKAAGQVVVGLAQQGVERELEVDAARVAGHARVEAAQQRARAARPAAARAGPTGRCPPRTSRGPGHRRGRRSGAPTTWLLPQFLDALGIATGQARRQIAREDRVHRGAAGAHRVGVADALGAVSSRTRTVISSKPSITPWVLSESATGSGMR